MFIKNFFTSLPANFWHSYSGKRAYLHLTAFALTAAIVLAGIDWQYFLLTRSELIHSIAWPAVSVGGQLPVLLPVLLIVLGHMRKNVLMRTYGWALGQAALLGSIVSSIYKALTGRVQPGFFNTRVDISREWNFGWWENGIFWGWPSSHTTIAFAVSVCLVVLLNLKGVKKWTVLAYASYIGLGISVTIHWLSEFVAGALIGTAVGLAVGVGYRKLAKKQ